MREATWEITGRGYEKDGQLPCWHWGIQKKDEGRVFSYQSPYLVVLHKSQSALMAAGNLCEERTLCQQHKSKHAVKSTQRHHQV